MSIRDPRGRQRRPRPAMRRGPLHEPPARGRETVGPGEHLAPGEPVAPSEPLIPGDPTIPRGTTPSPPLHDWRREIIGWSGLNVLAGIWLIIAPWVLGYAGRDPKWNDVIFGAIVAILALIRVAGAFRAGWLSLINAAIGAWIFIAAFTIDYSLLAFWNDIVLGAIVFIFAMSSADATAMMLRWRSRRTPPSVR